MRFQTPLVAGRLLRRYKRFLADFVLEADGREVTAHCPNPGAMTGLADPGMRCWLEPAGPGRKLPFGWRLVDLPDGHRAGIDTSVPNRVVAEALAGGCIPPLAGWPRVRAEVRMGARSRVDFLLGRDDGPPLWLEVKNVHLRRDGAWAEFPDCVTARGARHLHDLAERAAAGDAAAMVYVVQRSDCTAFRLARDIDVAYARAFDDARRAGVRMMAFGTRIAPDGVWLDAALPVAEDAQA